MKKIKCFAIIALIIILIPMKFIYADSGCSISFTADKDKIEVGQNEVTVKLKTTGITQSNAMLMLAATISYDPEIFEGFTVSGSGASKADSEGYDDENPSLWTGGCAINATLSPLTTNATITIKLRIKSGVSFTSTQIKLKDGQIVTQSGSDRFTPQFVTIEQVTPSPTTPPTEQPTTPPTEAPTTPPTETPTEAPTVTPTTSAPATKKPTATKTPGEYTGDKLPQTGKTVGIIAVISAGIGGAGIALFKYFQYKKILK